MSAKTYDELTLDERDALSKEEIGRLLNAKYANVPLPAHILNYGKSKKRNAEAKRRKIADNYLLPQHRNV